MLDALRELQTLAARLDKAIRPMGTGRVGRQDIRDSARALVDTYFREVRDQVAQAGTPDELLTSSDQCMHALLEATHGRSAAGTYRSALKDLSRYLLAMEKLALLGPVSHPSATVIDPTDESIIATLKELLPSAALSYEQAVNDLGSAGRMSWRGPATDLREALREVLDYLAPDESVKGQEGYRPEPNTNGPTMKQKVRFILKARGANKSAMQTPESAVDAVEEAVGTFVRSVYTRSNVSTHTPTDKAEVLRVRDWVRVALSELLAIQ